MAQQPPSSSSFSPEGKEPKVPKLLVEIKSATLNMKKGDDIYILLSIKKAQELRLLRTKLANPNANANPEWNHTFIFSIDSVESIFDQNFLISCKIIRARKFLPDCVIGETRSEINYLFPVGAAKEDDEESDEVGKNVVQQDDYDYDYIYDHLYDSINPKELEQEEIFKLEASANLPIMKGSTMIGSLHVVFSAWWAKKSPRVGGGSDGDVKANCGELSATIFRDSSSFQMGTLKMTRTEKMEGVHLVGDVKCQNLAIAMDLREFMMVTEKQPTKKSKSLGINCFACSTVKD